MHYTQDKHTCTMVSINWLAVTPPLCAPGVTLVVWTMDPAQQGLSIPCADGTRSTAGQLKTKVMESLGIDLSYSSVFAVWMTSAELCAWPHSP